MLSPSYPVDVLDLNTFVIPTISLWLVLLKKIVLDTGGDKNFEKWRLSQRILEANSGPMEVKKELNAFAISDGFPYRLIW